MRNRVLLVASLVLLACASRERVSGDSAVTASAPDTAASTAPRVISEGEWQEITPVVKQFLAAARGAAVAKASALATHSGAATTAIAQQWNTSVVAAALDKEFNPLNGGWDGDTLVALFAVPGRSMPAQCYQAGRTDELHVHLQRIAGAWKVHRLAGRYC